MSFYPDTDRASTWVALVMIGFMGVSILVWVWGSSPRDETETATQSKPAAPATVVAAEQKVDASSPAQPAAQTSLSTSLADKQTASPNAPQASQPIQASTQLAPNAQTQVSAPATVPADAGARVEAAPASSAFAPTPAPVKTSTTSAPTERPAAQEGGANPSGLVRGLRSRGHRVHAAVSGDARSMTLSVSGATLTRDAGVEWLGNTSTRQELKAAGIRVVVINNGQGSWTFML